MDFTSVLFLVYLIEAEENLMHFLIRTLADEIGKLFQITKTDFFERGQDERTQRDFTLGGVALISLTKILQFFSPIALFFTLD